MRITLYTICYNEQEILPYFLKHYSTFVDKIIIYNNNSTDNSIQILNDWKECEIEIRDYSTNEQYDEKSIMEIKNNCWKDNTDSDFIIVCDMDELLYHPNIKEFIKKQPFTDYFTPNGYHMIGDEIPTDYTKQIYDIIKVGTPDVQYNKNVLFKRSSITETNYTPGCHYSFFKGDNSLINCCNDELKLLHYKWLSFDYVYNKHQHYGKRRSEHSKNNGYGGHYGLKKERMINDFNKLKQNSSKVIWQ